MVFITYEDDLFDIVLPKLIELHNIENPEIQRKKKINNLEIDVFIKWRPERGPSRTLIAELKVRDIPKLIEQLLARRGLATWVYGVTSVPPREWIRYTLDNPEHVRRLLDAGIGVIALERDETPVVMLESRARPRKHLDLLTLREEVRR